MIEGKAKCEFGTGDILITPLCKNDFSKGAICLQNKGMMAIGEETSTDFFQTEENDTFLTFTKTDSIDVLIKKLEQLKSMMLGEVEGMMEYECDY